MGTIRLKLGSAVWVAFLRTWGCTPRARTTLSRRSAILLVLLGALGCGASVDAPDSAPAPTSGPPEAPNPPREPNGTAPAYPVTLRGATPIRGATPDTVVSRGDGFINGTIQFENPVPNGSGTLVLKLPNGRKASLQVFSVPRGAEYPGGPRNTKGEGELIDHLRAQWSPKAQGFGPDDLKDVKGLFYSDDYPPALTISNTLPERSNQKVDSIPADLAAPAYPVTLRGATPIRGATPDTVVSRGDGFINGTIQFENPVPNGSGTLVLKLPNGRKASLQVFAIPRGAEYPGGPRNTKGQGELIDHLRAQWSPKAQGFGPDDLKDAKGQFYSDDYPPALTTISTSSKTGGQNP